MWSHLSHDATERAGARKWCLLHIDILLDKAQYMAPRWELPQGCHTAAPTAMAASATAY